MSDKQRFVCSLRYPPEANALADCQGCGWSIGNHRMQQRSTRLGPFKPPVITEEMKVRILRDALLDLLMVIRQDDLIPESISYMQSAREALEKTK